MQAAEYAAAMVSEVSESMRIAIRNLIVRAFQEQIPGPILVQRLQEIIGLESRRAAALLNYRHELEMEGVIPRAQIDALCSKYSTKLIKQRAIAIARTEIMRALNAGALEMYRQARLRGLITDAAVKEWVATADEVTCPECGEDGLDGEVVQLDAAFSSGDLIPPAHPNCRCTFSVTEPLPPV